MSVKILAMSCQPTLRVVTILILTTALYPSCIDGNRSAQERMILNAKAEDPVHLRNPWSSNEPAPPGRFGTSVHSEISPEPANTLSTLPVHSPRDRFNPQKTDINIGDRVQSDSPASEGDMTHGKIHLPSSHVTEDWLKMRPMVHCSGANMILTAKGRTYRHLLVDRVGASPVSVLQLPLHCGYVVKASWTDLVLIAPYDGCYVLQENGRYVLPLLWLGRPVKISCPITPASTRPYPSGFCSKFGMVIKTDGPQGVLEKYYVKATDEWVPLVSNTCAYLVSATLEELIVFIPFTARCIRDGQGTINILLAEKEYTFTCQPPQQDALPPHKNPNSNFNGPYIATMESQAYIESMSAPLTEVPVTPFKPPVEQPMVSPSYQNFHYPRPRYMYPSYYPMHRQESIPPVSQEPVKFSTEHVSSFQSAPVPQDSPVLQLAQAHQLPNNPLAPFVPHAPQVPHHTPVHQHPSGFPVLPNTSSNLSPSLTCTSSHLLAELPYTKMESIKVKDVKRNMWVPVTSVPAHCGYLLQPKGKGVVFSSPMPACHSYIVTPSQLALSIKFWDLNVLQHDVLQFQCPYKAPHSMTTGSSTGHGPASSLMIKPTPIIATDVQKHLSLAYQQSKLNAPSYASIPLFPPASSQKPSVLLFEPPMSTASSVRLSKENKPVYQSEGSHWLPQTHLSTKPPKPQVLCHSQEMSVMLPPGPITGLTVRSPSFGVRNDIKAVLLDEAPSHCGYLIKKSQNGHVTVHLPYASCHMVHQDGQYRIILTYQLAEGHTFEVLLSCEVPPSHECNLPVEQRLSCGPSSISEAGCRQLGCCFCADTATCYYPMDECTADRHFVFSIPTSLMDPPLLPTHLVAAGNSSCTPQRVVDGLALFKIPLDGCGAHKYEIGKTVIYMLEILNTLQSLSLNYGTITRDSPFRLLVECRYIPGTIASVGYLVKSPSLGPSIQAQGVFGVQLRIAKDEQYSSYYPQYHRPLQKLLGKPLYLELRLLNPPDPSTVLLVHYCVAYPRSAQSAWVLIYDGCPNPLDVAPTHEPPPTPAEALAKHVRRFTVSTFQFLPNTNDDLKTEEEEIYFMCATEVCLPSEGPCVEGCFDRAVDFPAVKS